MVGASAVSRSGQLPHPRARVSPRDTARGGCPTRAAPRQDAAPPDAPGGGLGRTPGPTARERADLRAVMARRRMDQRAGAVTCGTQGGGGQARDLLRQIGLGSAGGACVEGQQRKAVPPSYSAAPQTATPGVYRRDRARPAAEGGRGRREQGARLLPPVRAAQYSTPGARPRPIRARFRQISAPAAASDAGSMLSMERMRPGSVPPPARPAGRGQPAGRSARRAGRSARPDGLPARSDSAAGRRGWCAMTGCRSSRNTPCGLPARCPKA